ncbi:MAG: MFS transporter [Pseudomonadota bacterium]
MRLLPLEAAAGRVEDFRSVFAIRDFRIYQIGNIASTLGFWMQRIAIGWVTWELTGSEALLGLVAFAELFPSILTGLWGGVLADRSSRIQVMLWGQLGVACVSAAFWLAWASGTLTPALIMVLMAALGALSGLTLPARLAMASVLTPGPQIATALAVNSTSFNLARFLGPALAGVLLVGAGAGVIFALAMLSYLLFAFCLHRLAPEDRPEARTAASFPEALSWLAGAGLVLAIMAVQLTQGLALRPASELFPAFADDVFDRGALGLGLLNAALGIGAIIGALAFAASGTRAQSLRQIFGGSLIFAASLAGFALVGPFWVALVMLVIQGAAMSSSNIAALTFVQRQTPEDRLGRILSIYTLVFRAAPALGALAFGLGAESAGLRKATLFAAGLGTLVTVALLIASAKSEARHAQG